MLASAFVVVFLAQAPPPPPPAGDAPSADAPATEPPKDAEAWTAEGQAAIEARDWSAAASAFAEARALDPEDASLAYRHAYALRKAGQLPAAVQAYQAHLQRVPGNADAWYALASTLESLERTAEARKAFARYAEVEDRPENQKFVELALAKAEQDVGTPDEGDAPPTTGARPSPGPRPTLKPALDALRAGNYRAALNLVPQDATDGPSEAARAGALLGMGLTEEAEAAWRRAISGLGGPAALAARFGLAEALRAQGKLTEAKPLYAQVADDPSSPPPLAALAAERR